MSRGKRTRVARNIYADQFGFQIVVQRGDVREEPRFPPGTPLDTLRIARDALIDRLELGAAKTVRGTLAADVATVLQTIPAGAHRRDTRTLLEHWLAAFGDRPRQALTPLQIKTQLAIFRGRFSPKTCKELRRLLGWVYTTLDGPDARNPVRAVPAPRVRYDDPRGIAYDVLARIFDAIPDRGRPEKGHDRPAVSLTKIRLRVMAFTGMHQIEIGRLTPRDVDLAGRRVWIHPRRKGTGTAGAWHGLVAPAADALRAFVEAKAFGPFDPRSMARTWRLALRKAEAAWATDPETRDRPWPVHADARPYDLRHSFGTAFYLSTGDIRAAQEALRHRQGSTTDRYTRAGVSARLAAGRDAFERHLAVPQTSATEPGRDVTKRPPMSQGADQPEGRRRRKD